MRMRQTAAAASAASSKTPAQGAKKTNDFGYPEVAFINDAIRKGWADHSLSPSKAATDGEWCRRVYLDLIGRVPTVDELTSYLATKKKDKRARARRSVAGRRIQRSVRAELGDDLVERSHWPNGRHGTAVVRGPRGDAEVSDAKR